jgi:hypothetical protein
MSKRLTDFYLPHVIHHWVDDERFPQTAHIRNFNHNTKGLQYKVIAETMNNNQRAVIQIITEAIERSPVTAHFFFEGAVGTGKTYLYRALCSYYCSRLHKDQDNNVIQKFVVCVASTGIVGLLLLGGQTAHFFSAVPLDATLGSKLVASSEQARLLQATQLIILKEVPIQNKEVVEAVDKCLHDITKVNSLSGGIPVALGQN